MGKSEKIISGPELQVRGLTCSLAENLIPRMKAQPKDRIAQIDGATGETITVHEFLRSSLEVAEGLIEFGVKEGDVIAFLSPNNIAAMTTGMGILFSGAIFAPVDHNLKPAELKQLLKQLQPKYLTCSNIIRETIQTCLKEAELNTKIIIIDSKTRNGEFFILDDLRKNVDLDNYIPRKVADPKKQPIIILCSSGSTGLPKGVVLSHYTLWSNSLAGEDSNVSNHTIIITSPLYWISGTLLLLISSYGGATRFIPKSTDPEDILEAIQNYKPPFLLMSPYSILSIVGNPNVKNYDLSSLKIIFIAGAVLGMSGVKKIKAVLTDVLLLPTYGLTETGGSVTTCMGPYKDLSLGKVLPGVQIKVVDVDTGESLGPKKTGECRVKTDRIMLGYYNKEEATKAAFDEDGWFRTGDLVYYDEDEEFFIVGRIKEVVKCRSFQVSLSELEAFIVGLPGVKDVAILPVPHELDTFHFKALVVKEPRSNITAEDIIQSVEENYSFQKQLHEGVEFVDYIPRSETGKLKRTQL